MYASLTSALVDLEVVANEINDGLHKKEARLRVVEVQAHLEGCTIPLVTPTRYHVLDGPLSKKYNNVGFKMNLFKMYHFFLFNDMMMYTTLPNAKGDCRLKYILPLIDMQVINIQDGALTKDVKYAFELRGSVKSFVVHAVSEAEKQDWVAKLHAQIEQVKTKKQNVRANANANAVHRTVHSAMSAGAYAGAGAGGGGGAAAGGSKPGSHPQLFTRSLTAAVGSGSGTGSGHHSPIGSHSPKGGNSAANSRHHSWHDHHIPVTGFGVDDSDD